VAVVVQVVAEVMVVVKWGRDAQRMLRKYRFRK
jgi:hypothetical protein